MSVIDLDLVAVGGAAPTRLAAAPPARAHRILAVEFHAPDGRSWNAIGGGDTVRAAIDWARGSCPDDTTWQPHSWNDLYGD
jgi:hypothetical protein